MKLDTQHYAIIEYLKRGNRLTPLEAIKVAGTMKLSTRVGELKKEGYLIADKWVKLPNGKKVKEYWLENGSQAPKEALDLGKKINYESNKPQNPTFMVKGQFAFLALNFLFWLFQF